jgi:hypothetical protein
MSLRRRGREGETTQDCVREWEEIKGDREEGG